MRTKSKPDSGRKKKGTARLIRLRYILVASIMVAIAGRIVYCAVGTTVVHADLWNKKANEELQKVIPIPPTRGDILACDGSVLATNLTYYDTRIDFKASSFSREDFLKALGPLSDSLAKYHAFNNSETWRRKLKAEVDKKPEERTSCFPFLYGLSYEQLERLRSFPFFRESKNPNVTGLTVHSRIERKNPYGAMARRSIGGVGERADTTIHGWSGLEAALDSLLFGKPGRARKVPLTHKIENWTDVKPRNGYNLTTTIDINMQDIAENALNEMLKEAEADWGTVILMHVDDGDIKAISNLERDSSGNYIEAMNHAMTRIEPGSVMKAISMTIALEDGFITDPEQMYETPKSGYYYGSNRRGTEIKDTHSPARLPISQFLRYSSNIGVTKLMVPHYEHDLNSFRERVRKIGLLDTFNTGILGEKPPYFPDLDPRRGGKMTLARQTYGYCMMIPPIYTCAFYNALANNGSFVRPRLLKRIQGEGIDSILPVTYIRKQMCSPENAATIRKWLKEVIYEKHGTAPSVKNPYVEAAGKTGTAKIAMEKKKDGKNDPAFKGGYKNSHRYAFVGFFPYEKPEYTCMVVISNPRNPSKHSPDSSSAMVFRDIMLRMYSRSMLGKHSDIKDSKDGPLGNVPILYADNVTADRQASLKKMLGSQKVSRIKAPEKVKGGIPDVRGLSVRSAVSTLEKAGFNVTVSGAGYVTEMSPAPNTAARPGTKVHLTLSAWRSPKVAKKAVAAANKTEKKEKKS